MRERVPKEIPAPGANFFTAGPAGMGLLATLLLLGGGGALVVAGCTSSTSSTEDDALSEFEGTWRVEMGTSGGLKSTYSLACPAEPILEDVILWDRIVLDRGPVSDLTETSGPGNCQFPFNVNGKIASTPGTDPYTGKMLTCSATIGFATDSTGTSFVDVFLDLFPTHWDFKLLAPVKGQAPTAQLVGNAAATRSDVDSACTYTTILNLTKIAQ